MWIFKSKDGQIITLVECFETSRYLYEGRNSVQYHCDGEDQMYTMIFALEMEKENDKPRKGWIFTKTSEAELKEWAQTFKTMFNCDIAPYKVIEVEWE